MFRRPGGKMMAVMGLMLLVCCLLVYQGNHVSGPSGATVRDGFRSYGKEVNLAQQQERQLALAVAADPSILEAGSSSSTRGTQPPETTTSVWRHPVYSERRHRTQDVCSKLRGGSVVRLTRWANFSYCVVPKVGCTFWLNVFRFLHGDTGPATYASPFLIPRQITHYGPLKNMKYFTTNLTSAPTHLANDLRFTFVREPYSRLWSAYVDKFLLIDYWRTEGRNIVRLRKDKSEMCARDISFREFVTYVVTRPNSYKTLNEHWKPIQHLCSPCLFQPHVIGKMETFARDSRYVLERLNMTWMLDTYNHEEHVHQEMDMLIAYNWQLLRTRHYVNCTNSTDLAARLWKTFQINGYLPTEKPFPAEDFPQGLNASDFQQLAHEAYRKRPVKSPTEWRHQREKMMADAFQEIPTDVLFKLRDLYSDDFELFDYEPEPELLFAGRRRTERTTVSGDDQVVSVGGTAVTVRLHR